MPVTADEEVFAPDRNIGLFERFIMFGFDSLPPESKRKSNLLLRRNSYEIHSGQDRLESRQNLGDAELIIKKLPVKAPYLKTFTISKEEENTIIY